MLSFRSSIRSLAHRLRAGLIVTAWTLLAAPGQLAQAPQGPPPAEAADPEDVPQSDALEAKIKEIEASKQLDELLRSKILEGYRLALSQVEAAQRFAAKDVAYRQAVETAPQETAKIRESLKAELAPAPEIPSGMAVPDLETRIVQAQAELTTLRANLNDIDTQSQAQADRPQKAQAEQGAARDQLKQIDEALTAATPLGELPALTDSRKAALRARKHARNQELRALEQEVVGYSVRLDLLKARRDLAARNVAEADARLKRLQDGLNTARKLAADQARQAADDARREAIGKHPLIRSLAAENSVIGAELARVTDQTAAATQESEVARRQRTRTTDEAKDTKDRLRVLGLTNVLGQLLREQRSALPDERRFRMDALKRQDDLGDAGLRQIRLEQAMRKRKNLAETVQSLVRTQVDPGVPDDQRAALSTEAEDLLKKQRELSERLVGAYEDYRQSLQDLQSEASQLVAESQSYRTFLDEQLFWLPNLPRVGSKSIPELMVAIRWFTAPQGWIAVAETLWKGMREHAAQASCIGIGLLVILAIRPRLRRRLDTIAGQVGRVYTDHFALTVQAMLITILLVLPWPVLSVYLSYLLRLSLDSSDFVRAFGEGLRTASYFLFGFMGASAIILPNGLGHAHFRWSDRTTTLVRRNNAWLAPILISSMFLVSVTGWEGTPPETDTLGRVAFFVAMAALAIYTRRVFRPEGGIGDRLLSNRLDGWLWRLRYPLYTLLILVPISLGVLAATGYYYTALILSLRILRTSGFLVEAVIIYDIVLRWFYVARAKLAVAKAREEYEAHRIAGSGNAEGMAVTLETQTMDLAEIDEGVRKLLRAFIAVFIAMGLWFVWADVVPGLRVLQDVHLWPYTVMVGGQEVLKPVTLADLILAVIISVFTTIAAKNIPALLEIAILRHLPMDVGSRYAFSTLSRYSIVALGLGAALHAVGASWEHLRWLLAAIGLGLGFGLQEIFANLISGIMILFERPFSVGDVVTVGDMTGIVSRVRIRATTLVDWDRREVIIPNKTFITDKLVNWTLSDQVTRIVLKVGIGFGSNPSRAHAVMLEAAKAHSLVLTDPPAAVVFSGFGESSLDFEVRVFVRKMDDRLPVTHELNIALHKALADNGIEIPFPQRDLHLRTSDVPLKLDPGEWEKAKDLRD